MDKPSQVIYFMYSDHNLLTISYPVSRPTAVNPNFNKTVVTRPVSAGKIINFECPLNNVNWVHLLKESNTASAVFTKFFSTFLHIFDICIPKQRINALNQGHRGKPSSMPKKW